MFLSIASTENTLGPSDNSFEGKIPCVSGRFGENSLEFDSLDN